MANNGQDNRGNLEEVPATLDDFFSDERESDSTSGDDDSDTQAGKSDKRPSDPSKKKKQKKKAKTGPAHSLPSVDLSHKDFRKYGKELVDFIADYMEGCRDKAVHTDVFQGFLFRKMSATAPKEASTFENLMEDLKKFILPGVPQWQSPGHHAMLPLGSSYASLLGSMLCDGLGSASLTWSECPAAVELEMVVMNWLAELMDLPLDFHFFGKGAAADKRIGMNPQRDGGVAAGRSVSRAGSMMNANPGQGHTVGGGGIIMSTTTECLLTVMASAKRVVMTQKLLEAEDTTLENEMLDRLMVYTSEQAHPSIERVCEVIGVKVKRLWTDRQGILHCSTLKSVLDKDKAKGYIPFIVIATAGSIASSSVDQINAIGPMIGERYPNLWLHIDACYAGSAFLCREYQPLLHGIGYADSINVNVHKWLPVHMDCACLWVRKITNLTFTFGCEEPEGPLTIPVDNKNIMADYRHWGLPMMRRFKAIKIWTVFKLYGFKKLQQKIREDVRRAKEFEKVMQDDHRFEIMTSPMFGIITFRCKRPDSNEVNRDILDQINRSRVIKMSGARVGNKFWLRFVVAGRYTSSEDVLFSWEMIKRATSEITTQYTERKHNEDRSGVPNYKHVVTIGKEVRLDELDASK